VGNASLESGKHGIIASRSRQPPPSLFGHILHRTTKNTLILAHNICTLALDANDTNQRVVKSRLFTLMFGKNNSSLDIAIIAYNYGAGPSFRTAPCACFRLFQGARLPSTISQ